MARTSPISEVRVIGGQERMILQRRIELQQWHHDEIALGHAGMGHGQIRGVDLVIAVQQHVDVQRAGPPAHEPDPTGPLFQFPAATKQSIGAQLGPDLDDDVVESVLLDTADGFGLVDARHGDDRRGGVVQPADRPSKVVETIADVGAEAEEGPDRGDGRRLPQRVSRFGFDGCGHPLWRRWTPPVAATCGPGP